MIIKQKMIYREDLQANPNVLYIFGDNEMRTGKGGQAFACRGEPNAFGIRTKKAPLFAPEAYWYDETYDNNIKLIDEDFTQLQSILWDRCLYNGREFEDVVVPLDGIGTGMANLKENAPRTLEYLTARWNYFLSW